RVILCTAVAAGLFAAFLTRQYMVGKDREVQRELARLSRRYQRISVVTVTRDLPAGSVIQTADIGAIDVVESQMRSDRILQEDWRSVVGRKALHRLDKGAPLFWTDIEGGSPGQGRLSQDVKETMRALSISVGGAAAVSGMVRPNDHVDVIGTFTFPSKEHPGEDELVTFTVVQDVTVLATGTETSKSPAGATGAGGRGAASYGTVTLEVTPREAEMLVFAEQIKGRLVLALRNPADVHYEKELPRVDFDKVESEIERLNLYRQRTLLKKRD
ncbi:MAG: Flp pilus assembly protein CpaB, partial [Kiritimatiellae bacterium]|nr:Flp pilus assembly protein CpaB [Kiritimatiellia bacterium]